MKNFFTFYLFAITSCATFKHQVDPTISQELPTTKTPLSHRFYLIGDAGNADIGGSTPPLILLNKRLQSAPENSTVIYLGDNVYNKGIPKKSHPDYTLALHRLQTQIDAVKGFKGRTIFTPGNHDYYSNGIKSVKAQQKIVEKALGKKSYLPRNGCPITQVKISDDVALIVVDTQWYLENWNNNPTMNDDCDIKDRLSFFLEFEALIKKNRSKVTLVALHHPMMTDGPHGGNFSAKQHISPSNDFPLPVLGTIANFIRKTGGVSPQDLQNKNYRYLANRLMTISQEAPHVIFASGHEHSLQYIDKNNVRQIVSGSGSKSSGVRKSKASNFAYSTLGYAILDVYQDQSTQVKFVKTEKNQDNIVFKKEIFSPEPLTAEVAYLPTLSSTHQASVYPEKVTQKNAIYKALWGKHYREEYGKKIQVPVAYLDTLYGGLTPIKRGGGNQSVSLRLVDPSGRQWVMRALKKSAVQFLQINAYQQRYIRDELTDTKLEAFVEDIYTTTHPYASFIMPTLSRAVGVFHTTPELYYVPKQPTLGKYNDQYGDALYMIEEHVGDTQTDRENFGNPDDIISSLDLFEKLQKNPKHQVDEKAFIRARLFDMVLGDWDRHQDQWRWSKFKSKKQNIYRPIPRDRDQVFAHYDGLVVRLATSLVPVIRKMQVYTPEVKNLRWHNTNGRAVDMALLKSLTLDDWLAEVLHIKTHLTDEVIDQAFSHFPKEVQTQQLVKVKEILRYRRDNVQNIAKKYYKILNKSIILTATHKDDDIVITRQENRKTTVEFTHKKKTYFKRTYDKQTTKEIWLYALDGDDHITINGKGKNNIRLRVLGGQNNDTYTVENGKKTTIYDFKSKKNDLTNAKKAKVRLIDEYQTNTYAYLKRRENINEFVPIISINDDDGFYLGANHTLTVKKLRQNPFSHRHQFRAIYYLTTKGHELDYIGEYANIFNQMNVLFSVRHTSPQTVTNFFGFGNETINETDKFDIDYHKLDLATTMVNLGIIRSGIQGSELVVSATLESNKLDTAPSIIDSKTLNDPKAFERKNFLGAEAIYSFENYNDIAYPTLGMNFEITAGWKTRLISTSKSFGYIIPSFSFNHPLTGNERLVLANKTKAHWIVGQKEYEFYQAATLGAHDGLRGYRFQRFSGDISFYNSTDLRFSLKKLRNSFVPLHLGIYTGFDLGRVWYGRDNSNKWHYGYGGGLTIRIAEMTTANFGLFTSVEDTRFSFQIGFRY